MNLLRGIAVLGALVTALPTRAELPVKVRAERPRIYVKAEEWQGPNIPKLKEWFKLPEYKKRGIDGKRWAVLHWLVNGDNEAGKSAIEGLVKRKIGGSSPSYSGKSAQFYAAYYDWLRNHPDFTPEKRAACVAELEKWGDYFTRYIKGGTAFFYSRFPGAISGLGTIGLALYGDSPKADAYIALAYESFVEYGRARAWEGGGTAGGNYSLYHAFPDLGRLACAFESATDADILKFVREKQDNWLEKQLYWQLWYTFPTGYFVKEGDLWRHKDNEQFRMNIDILTGLLDNGYGRSHADAMYKRWGTRDYHSSYLLDFFVFNNPEVDPRPVSELGRAALFGRDSHGYVFMRSGWGEDDTLVFFKCGEGMDVHCFKGEGGFIIWRKRTLAERAGKYYAGGKGGSTWHNNTMVFISDDDGGTHPNTEISTDVKLDFDAFLARKKRRGIETGSILEYEATDTLARVKGDLTAAVRKNCEKWTRELVFFDYKYLLVLDRVKTKPKKVKKHWLLNLAGEYSLDGKLATTELGGSTLFCLSLLPEKAVLTTEDKGREKCRLTVADPDDSRQISTFLHVLHATATEGAELPECAVAEDDGNVKVMIGNAEYVFGE